jgi:hypothetical protein
MEDIVFIGSSSSGVFDTEDGMIEEGQIHIDYDGEDIHLTIQIDGNGDDTILLDDMEYKPLLESLGIEFYDEEELIGPESFLVDLRIFYDSSTKN